jgi:hypothetical protein
MNAAGTAKATGQTDNDAVCSSVYQARWLIIPVFSLALAFAILVALSL